MYHDPKEGANIETTKQSMFHDFRGFTRTRGGDPGESMNKIIPNNSVIGIIEYDSVYDLKNGDIVVHSTQDSECAVKYFYRDGNKLIFRPYSTNPNYYDTIFDINDNVKIIGKVVQYSVTL